MLMRHYAHLTYCNFILMFFFIDPLLNLEIQIIDCDFFYIDCGDFDSNVIQIW